MPAGTGYYGSGCEPAGCSLLYKDIVPVIKHWRSDTGLVERDPSVDDRNSDKKHNGSITRFE